MTAGVVQLVAKLVQFGADQGAPTLGHGAAIAALLARFAQFRLVELAREDQEVVMIKPALSEAGVELRTDPRFVIGESGIDADSVDTITPVRVIAPIGSLFARRAIPASVIRVCLGLVRVITPIGALVALLTITAVVIRVFLTLARVITPIGALLARRTIPPVVIGVGLILKCLCQRTRRQKDRRHAEGKRDGGS